MIQKNRKEDDFFFTIEKMATAEFKDRGSKFLGYAIPIKSVEEFKERLNDVKKEHPKATHHCYAYRIGLDGNTFRVSDDGEPSGSAGRPILGQIDSKELTNVLVVVVRYFGGTLLGVPGLINAYKSAAALALQMTPLVQRAVEKELYIQFDYTQINDVLTLVKQYNCRIITQEIQLFCSLTLGVPRNRVADFAYQIKDLRNVEVKGLELVK